MLGGNASIQFDPRKFTLARLVVDPTRNDAYLMSVRTDTPVKIARRHPKPGGDLSCSAAPAEGATGNDVPIILREALGLNIKQIVGYPDSDALFLAIERKEVDGRTTDLSSVRPRPEWLKPDRT